MRKLGEIEVPHLSIVIKSQEAPTIDELRPYLVQVEAHLLEHFRPFLENIRAAEAQNAESLNVEDSNWLTALVLCDKVIHCEYADRKLFVLYKDAAVPTSEK